MRYLFTLCCLLLVLSGCQQAKTVSMHVAAQAGDVHTLQDSAPVFALLDQVMWQQAKVQMTSPPDYRFYNVLPDSKAVVYMLWLEHKELMQGTQQYAKLTDEQAQQLLTLLQHHNNAQ